LTLKTASQEILTEHILIKVGQLHYIVIQAANVLVFKFRSNCLLVILNLVTYYPM